ncbi:MAG: hypothetical protein ACLFWL_15015 [Candidatus Brocadiia bacterium]
MNAEANQNELDGFRGQSSPAQPVAVAPDLIHIYGHRESLSLDDRFRFRIPDRLASVLQQELGRVGGDAGLTPAARQKLAFYFVPGPANRIFLYPAANIQVAISRFESPPPGTDPELVRAARDYFYRMMTFVEADRQNRVQIPEHLCGHAGIDGQEGQIVLASHNVWLSVARASEAEKFESTGRDAFETVGPDVLDPVNSSELPPQRDAEE